MSRSIFFIMACYLLVAAHSLTAAESYLNNSAMYADKAFEKEQYTFDPYDKIFIVLDFTNLQPGQYNLAVDWITPFGNLERQTTYTITATEPGFSQRVYFWLKLMKRGPLKRTLTGREFKEEFHGEWKVNYYLNGVLVGSKTFEMH